MKQWKRRKRYSMVITLCIGTFIFLLSSPLFFGGMEGESSASNTTLYVDASGKGDFLRIQDAIDMASPHDTIYIKKGLYTEHLQVNKSLIITGEDRETTVIDGDLARTVINISADNVNISNLTIQNSGRGLDAGVKIDTASHVNISRCTLFSNYYGIWVYQSTYNALFQCRIHQNYYGILIHYVSQDNIVLRCQVEDNENTGIYLCCASIRTLISECTIFNNTEYGIDIHVPNTTVYLNNLLDNGVNARSAYSTIWDNGEKGNYWSDFDDASEGAHDANGDGIIDESHDIPENNQDTYPLADLFSHGKKERSTPGLEFTMFLFAITILLVIHKKHR